MPPQSFGRDGQKNAQSMTHGPPKDLFLIALQADLSTARKQGCKVPRDPAPFSLKHPLDDSFLREGTLFVRVGARSAIFVGAVLRQMALVRRLGGCAHRAVR